MHIKILSLILALNVIATGYAIYTIQKQSKELENVGVALGQIGTIFTQSRIVSTDKVNGVVVNQVITTKDIQEQQPSF